jgi:hypothetical protein
MSGRSALFLGERIPGSGGVGVWVDPRVGLDEVTKKNISFLAGNETLVVHSVV